MRLNAAQVGIVLAASCFASSSFADQVASPPATMANNLQVKFIDQKPTDQLASKLVGASINNNANDTIGSIADLVLDENNKVRSYVVSVGGLLGVGSKYVAVDPSVVKITHDKNNKPTVSIDTDKDQLKAAPEYRYLSEQKNKDQ